MGCIFRVRLNQLGSIWYTVICVAVQIYLLFLGLRRYHLYAEMKWPHGAYPQIWLTVYVTILTVCIPLLVLFAAFGIFKSGNLAGDNEQIGARFERIIELTQRKQRNAKRRGCWFRFCHALKSFWQHSPPFPATIHIVLAICQLLAQQIMLAQLYRYGFINSGDFLNTELDFAYHRSRQLVTNLPMGDTRLQGFRITSDELAESPMAPNLLPILMHARLFGISLEFLNFVVALISYSCTYSSVFWRLSKAFSLCFSFHLLIYTVTLIYTYLAFTVLFRVQETNYYSIRPVGIGQYLWTLRPLMVYHPLAIIGTFAATIVLMHVSTVVLYSYGYNKYFINLLRYRRSILARQNQHAASSAGSTIAINSKTPRSRDALSGRMCCDGYGPHIFAILILMLIVVVKAPALYALTILYQQEEKPLILSCICVDVVYLFAWILMWLALTLKRDWRVRVAYDVREILSLQNAAHTADGQQLHGKSISELKNALLVMHGDHLLVTDDPILKPSIMRHISKACAEDDAYWLRPNPSPANRRIPMENCNGTSAMSRVERTPELGRLLDGTTTIMGNNCGVLPYENDRVPLAAAPYHYRMTSLPPASHIGNIPTRPMMGSSMTINNNNNNNNNFGTIKHASGMQYSSFQKRDNPEYGTLRSSLKPIQQQQQMLRQNGGAEANAPHLNYASNTIGKSAQNRLQESAVNGAPRHSSAQIMSTPMMPRATIDDDVYGNMASIHSATIYGEYGGGGDEVGRERDNASTVSANTIASAGNSYARNGVNLRMNSAQNANGNVAGIYDVSTVGHERRPTFHSVDFKSKNITRTALNGNYNTVNNKFVSFNENGIKTTKAYGDVGGGTGQNSSELQQQNAAQLNHHAMLNTSQAKRMDETSLMSCATPPSPSTVTGDGTSGMSRDNSATSGSNATVSTLSAKSSSNGSYFYGDGTQNSESNAPTPMLANDEDDDNDDENHTMRGRGKRTGSDGTLKMNAPTSVNAETESIMKHYKFPINLPTTTTNVNKYNNINHNNNNNNNNNNNSRSNGKTKNVYATSIV